MFKLIFLSFLLIGSSSLIAEEKLKPWEGTFKLKQGDTNGKLKIENCKNKTCSFSIEAETGAHLCEASGTLSVAKDNISATQNVNVDEKDECLVKFVQRPNGTLGVTALHNEKCHVSCGAGAHYDGEYRPEGEKKNFKTGFNCKKANSLIEKTICTDKLLADGDLLLSLEYDKIQKNLSLRDTLKSSQQKWLEVRNLECRSDNLKECLIQKYRGRIIELMQFQNKEIAKTNTANNWVFSNYKFAIEQLPNGFLINSLIYLEYGSNVLEDLDNYRLNYSTEMKTNQFYSIEGSVFGAGALRVLITIDPKFIWIAFKNEDNDIKNKVIIKTPVGATKAEAPDFLKKWSQEK